MSSFISSGPTPGSSRRREVARATSRVKSDHRELKESLMDLKAAQKWFASIYGRFALSLAELDSVSYKAPEFPLEMIAQQDGGVWRGNVESRYVRCSLEVPTQQLPACEYLAAASDNGTETRPLSTSFGEGTRR